MRYLLVLACAFGLSAAVPLTAQTINPYLRLTDPLAIARLDEPDFAPLRYDANEWASGTGGDSMYPGYTIVAQDTGAGIITHLFVITRTPDSLTGYKLIVDGQILRSATDSQFYLKPSGYFHSPFDTIIGEARLGDVQVPYRNGFELLFKSTGYYWSDYGWRPLHVSDALPDASLNSNLLSEEESQAAAVYRNPSLLWQGTSGRDTTFSANIPAHKDTTLLRLNGSAVVSNLKITPGAYDTTLDSVWLDMYYDDAGVTGGLSDQPAFSTPLLALFGQSFTFQNLHSLAIDFSKDSGFTMRLPIPFAHSVRMAIRNLSQKSCALTFSISYIPQEVDVTKLGYLHAAFSESNPTRYHVPHPVLHRTGKGVYVGLLMGIHHRSAVQDLEGDPIFNVDSNAANYFQYGGTEDYFDGAMYFSCGPFLSPFGGAMDAESYYRFHYLDALDFNKSFDFDLQPGNAIDARDDYRTLALWYERQIPFWTDRDTVRAGETWEIAGAGYDSNEKVDVMLDSILVGHAVASPAGAFDLRTFAPNINSGFYSLSVNGVVSPTPILVSNGPTIVLTDLPKPLQKQAGDTLHFSGAGFVLGDTVMASISGVGPAVSKSSIDFSHRITGWLVIPELADGDYHLTLYGRQSGTVTSSETIRMTRTLRFECENLWTSSSSLIGTSRYLNLEFIFGGPWSQNAVLDFDPVPTCKKVSVPFYVPYADTFAIGFEYGRDSTFGNYDIVLDSSVIGHIVGYNSSGLIEDSLPLGEMFLPLGDHSLSFQYTGRAHGASDSALWADFIQLDPTGTFQNAYTPLAAPNPANAIFLYPNPASDELFVLDSSATESSATFSITDELGRIILRPSAPLPISVAKLPSGIYHLKMLKAGEEFERSFSVIH